MEKKFTQQDYLNAQSTCGLKVGDKVKVLRKAEDFEQGWLNSWAEPRMTNNIGSIGTIKDIETTNGHGIEVRFAHERGRTTFQYPFFVLQKATS